LREISEEEQVPRGALGTVPTVFATHGPKRVPRVDYERIFVLDAKNDLLGEYVLTDDCPLEYADLRRSIPMNGMRHLVSFYQGEYAFTPFKVDDLWFVVLTRGVPRIEERGSIGTLLAAARIHLLPALEPALARREKELRERERELQEREAVLLRREQRTAQVEAELQLAGIQLREREAELRARENKVKALQDYAIEMQRTFLGKAKTRETKDASPAPEVSVGP